MIYGERIHLRAVERDGIPRFVHEGKLQQSIYRNGRYIDVLLMSILRSEWDAKK